MEDNTSQYTPVKHRKSSFLMLLSLNRTWWVQSYWLKMWRTNFTGLNSSTFKIWLLRYGFLNTLYQRVIQLMELSTLARQ